MQIKCYFYIDGDQDDPTSKIRALCGQCHQIYPDLGWHYEGLCGEWVIQCGKCNGVIAGDPSLDPRTETPSSENYQGG
jgi:hypothetical protein